MPGGLDFEVELQNSEGDMSWAQEHVGPFSEPSTSTAPYVDPFPRTNHCSGKDNTCMAYSTKATRKTDRPLCVGCARSEEGDE